MSKFLTVMFLSIAMFLAGCTIHSIPTNYPFQKEKESIVIGSLSFPDSGIPLISKPIGKVNGSFSIHTVIAKNQRMYGVVPDLIDNAYYFYIPLPQGRYCLSEITWGEFRGVVDAIFNVYENGKIYYMRQVL
ncbi:MAG: hypothetical protein A2176_06460 [Spirochaetes bacterium RBG_13_51_14]|nr:MAG: hypothetical protein A2176_06460 [Spirochaetes bacterium RBG_13_51_14]